MARKLPYLVLIAGIFYSLSLLMQILPGSILSVDSGLKYLMVRQYAEGNFSPALHSDKPAWVQKLWSKGFFPVREPFVLELSGEHVVVFPPFFQLLSTPFFMAFGIPGLLIIPLLSLWILWSRLIALCRHLELNSILTSLAAGILIFGSPLTIYGVEFWEHTLGVLLVFFCFEFALLSEGLLVSKLRAGVYGVLSGLSVWIRPESFVLLLPLLLLILFRRGKRSRVFLLSVLLALGGYFAINLLVSGRAFGFHGHQVLDSQGIGAVTDYYLSRFLPMIRRLLKTFPVVVVFIGSIPFSALMLKRRDLVLFSISLLFFFVVSPVLLPNSGGGQWGPRYFLVALAPVVVILTLFLDSLGRASHPVARYIFVGLVLASMVFSSLVNCSGGPGYLFTVHQLRAAALGRYLGKSNITEIITGCDKFPIEVAELYDEKDFYYSKDLIKGAEPILEEFSKRGVRSFFLVTPKENIDLPKAIRLKDGHEISFSYRLIPLVSLYRLVEVSIQATGGSRASRATASRIPRSLSPDFCRDLTASRKEFFDIHALQLAVADDDFSTDDRVTDV